MAAIRTNTHLVLSLFLMSIPALHAQDATETMATLPEEITITGERPTWQLREELLVLEQRAYDIFNELNDEDRFDIVCRMHAPTGSRIERQVCTPVFQLEATAAHARDYVDGTNLAMPQEMVIASQLQAFRSKMREITEEHAEFREALIEYGDRRREFGDYIYVGE